MSIRFEHLTRAHLDAIQLRPEDAREASEGWKDAADPERSVAAVDTEGRVVAVFGIVEGAREVGVWLLCSDLVDNHRATLWRHAKGFVKLLRKDPRLAFNFIPKDSHGNRRFVERLGFRILPTPGGTHDFFYLPHV